MGKKLFTIFWESKFIFLVILLGSVSWVAVMIRSGLIYDYGVGFWGPNGHDGVWHLALAEGLARFRFEMPTFAGAKLMNYHVGFDLVLAGLFRLTGISISVWYFQILPVVFSFLIGGFTFWLLRIIKYSKTQIFWAEFLIYFGGSWGWALGKGESTFWAQQAVSTLINPPFAMSLAIMLFGTIALAKKKYGWVILCFGVLIQVKAYAGVLALGGLFVAAVYEFILKRKYGLFGVWALSAMLAILLFLPLNGLSGELVVLKPFWLLETMMQVSDRVGWVRFGEAMVNYKYGQIWWKAVPAYGVAFLIFWYGNMGMRLIGEFTVAAWVKDWRRLGLVRVFMVSVILGGVVLPMFFVQKGTPWNTIQFFYYSLFFMSIIAGVGFGAIVELMKKKSHELLLVVGIVGMTLPTSYQTLKNNYLTIRPPSYLPNEEVEALKFLSAQPAGVVLTYPFDEEASKRAEAPKPLYLYVTTAYVSAYSKKPVYLEDEMNLDITGFDWRGRRSLVEEFYESLDENFVYDFLRENNISYIYWVGGQRARLGETQLGIERIFENSKVDIYIVQ